MGGCPDPKNRRFLVLLRHLVVVLAVYELKLPFFSVRTAILVFLGGFNGSLPMTMFAGRLVGDWAIGPFSGQLAV